MVKRMLALLTVAAISLCAVHVLAEEEESAWVPVHKMDVNEVAQIELSLEEALKVALENNPRINAADASIKSAELSLEVTEESEKEYKDSEKLVSKIPGVSMAVNISAGLDQAYLKHGYYTHAAGVGVELANMSKEQVTAAVSYEVTEKYYNVKLMESLMAISKTSVNLAKDNLTLMENQLEAGYVSALEVRNAKNAVTQAENSVKGYERNLNLAVRSLKVSLGMEDTDCSIVLTDEISVPEVPTDAQGLISAALNTRYDMTAVRKDYEMKKMLYDITKMYAADKTAMYHSAYSDYLNSEYTYNNTIKMMQIGLESEYAAILSASDAIGVAENDLAFKEDMYDSKKTMYDLGLITNLELTSAMAELDSSKVQLENARVTYALAVIKFGYNTTIGI